QRRAAHARPLPQAERRQGVRDHGRRDDRATAAVALQRLPPHRGRGRAAGAPRPARRRRGGAGVRDRRLPRPGPRDRGRGARRAAGRALGRRVRLRDGLQLQLAPAPGRGARRRRPVRGDHRARELRRPRAAGARHPNVEIRL
ncbi:MAG: Diaminopimelate decarboxylase, partial [uncultured Gemmatimonadaceae bacterium]